MSCNTNSSDINQTFIIEPLAIDDIYTTGATLINNIIYFDRTDALSAYTANLSSLVTYDTYVTGMTFSNNLLTITRNDGIAISANINTLTGLTVNGSISATTFFGDGSNLTGISKQDTYVTGGTYSNGTAIFTNNSGGTFNITGFSTGYTLTSSAITSTLGYIPYNSTNPNGYITGYTDVHTTGMTFNTATYDLIIKGSDNINYTQNLGILASDIYTTGGTYSNGIAVYTNNSGYTFNVTGFTTPFTGGTVAGITAATISATTYIGLPLDIHTTGMTFNTATYDLSISDNEGNNYTQNLGILASDMTITGGTYNPATGTATFTNNSGGTFNVTGFVTGFTDVYTTGGTFTNNTLSLRRNDGVTYSISGFSTISPFETIIEGGNTGITRTNRIAANYGNIGQDAVDLSISNYPSTTAGATGFASFAEGFNTQAIGDYSHAEGLGNIAGNAYSHVEGWGNTVNGGAAHAEGRQTTANGYASHAQNINTSAIGQYSHAGGNNSIASGDTSFIHSTNSSVNGNRSIVLGGSGITGNYDDTVYVPNLNLNFIPIVDNTISSILGRKSDGSIITLDKSGFSSSDTYVTGGTYSNGTAIFTNNSGSTFSVSGFSTGTTTDISNLVPYTGATKDVNLGLNNLYTNKLYLYNEVENESGSIHYADEALHFSNSEDETILWIEPGFIQIHKTPTIQSNFWTSLLTENRDHYLPDISGTIALTSQLNNTYTTGGTYSNGTAIFTNNSGGTFNITGFSTGYTLTSSAITSTLGYIPYNSTNPNGYITGFTNTYTTGATKSGTIATFINNTGGTFTLTGLTDTYTTGGTYSNGTAIFTNNTGGTYNVSGFFTGTSSQWTTSGSDIYYNTGNVGIGSIPLSTARLRLFDNTLAGSGSLAGSLLDLQQTWNTTGVVTALKLNVTNTASASGSKVVDFQVAGVSKLNLDVNGTVNVNTTLNAGAIQSNGNIQALFTSGFQFNAGTWTCKANPQTQNPNGGIVYTAYAGYIGGHIFTIATSTDAQLTSNNYLMQLQHTFAPTASTGAYAALRVNPTINQTGTASGVTRGILIDGVLTNAVDFRALEIQTGKVVYSSTITPAGTTGNQVIHKISGKVNAAATTTSLVVTNNLVTTSSIVMCQLGTNDATCVIKSVVEGTGSFTINYTAPTAETVIKFKVIN